MIYTFSRLDVGRQSVGQGLVHSGPDPDAGFPVFFRKHLGFLVEPGGQPAFPVGNAQIRFQYFNWNVDKEMLLRRNGGYYEISPWALTWNDENYYLVGYDSGEAKIKHFRVDKMLHIEMLPEKREGREVFQEFDMAVYERKMFGMFDGREENVKLLCDNAMAGIVIDRFGKNVPFLKKDAEHFTMNVKVAVSRQFFSWVMGLGSGIQIIGPVWVVDEMKEEIRRLSKQYLQENQHESGITGSDEKI